MLTAEQRTRYARHLVLGPVGEAGQARLLAARARLDLSPDPAVGMLAAMYLAAAGVGHVAIRCTQQTITASDVARCIVLTHHDVGRLVVDVLRERVQTLTPDTIIAEDANEATIDAGHDTQPPHANSHVLTFHREPMHSAATTTRVAGQWAAAWLRTMLQPT